ncbi:MAG: hypothetical protein HYS08_03780 [Chlamydiae bacterium]|nr:hypothetical protein [Chlamydiota bacterium]MBI3266916.1 hypothetical protein [Chlamydiota bacterium]
MNSNPIPADMGEITDQVLLSGNPTVFLIEDIHCNPEVERNIARILKVLKEETKDARKLGSWEAKQQKLSPSLLASQLSSQSFCVFSEAATGWMDMSFFTAFPKKEILPLVQDQFIQDRDINGVESFLMGEKTGGAIGLGVEELQPYLENVKLMNELMEERELQEHVWSDLEELFQSLREKIYPQELLELMKKKKQYEDFKIGMGEYLQQLNVRGLKLEEDFPQISLYLKLQTLEKKTDMSRVESEYLSFLQTLEKQLTKEELNEVMKNVLEHRLGRIGDEAHYLFLSKYLEPEHEENVPPLFFKEGPGELGVGGVMEEVNNPTGSPYIKGREKQKELYPNLKFFIEQMSLMKKISWEKLDSEVEKLAGSVERSAYRGKGNEKEIKRLLKLENDYTVLKRVISMEGKREDLKAIWSGLRSPLKLRGVRGVMKEEEVTPSIPLKKIRGRKNSQREEEYVINFSQALRKLCEENNLSFESPDFENIFQTAKKFYKKVLDRDKIFYQKLSQEIKEKKLQNAAVVVGGFHTDALKEKLKEAEMGYCVIAPHSEKIDDRRVYFQKMKEFNEFIEEPSKEGFYEVMEGLGEKMLQKANLSSQEFDQWEKSVPSLKPVIQALKKNMGIRQAPF